jgi:CRP/FNR family cyclic AMP-dependent transcriptional regulator
MEKDIQILQATDLFKNIGVVEIKKLLEICHKVNFTANEIIMKEGDIGDSLYIILRGTVEVIKSLVISEFSEDSYHEAHKDKVFTKLDEKSHSIFGEIALLDERKRTATIRAVTGCSLFEIKKNDFLNIIENDNSLGCKILLNLARIVSTRLRKADEDTIKLTTVLSLVLRNS